MSTRAQESARIAQVNRDRLLAELTAATYVAVDRAAAEGRTQAVVDVPYALADNSVAIRALRAQLKKDGYSARFERYDSPAFIVNWS